MFQHESSIFCEGCGAEICWAPVIADQRRYCCSDCTEGRACTCGMQAEWEDERRSTQAQAMEV